MSIARWKLLVIPMVALLVVALVGWWGGRVLEQAVKLQVRAELEVLLKADVTALRLWVENQRHAAAVTADRPDVRRLTAALLRKADVASRGPTVDELRGLIEPVAAEFGYAGWAVLSPELQVLAAGRDEVLGISAGGGRDWLLPVLGGEATVTKPLGGDTVFEGGVGGEPTVFSAAPIRSDAGEPIALLGFRIPADEFTRILTVARMGESGETYAFDADGLLMSHSRFDDQLRGIGLLPAEATASIHNIEIRNPGGDMTAGFVPREPLRARPLTRMAAIAITGEAGVDVEGYRDYRGVPVVGAWTWLPELGIGVTVEVDVQEAFQPLFKLRAGFYGLLGLMALGSLGALVYATVIDRLRRRVKKAERLGQYKLIRKIGEGGMGMVYLAEHAMLRRPTAVKMMRPDGTDELQMKRFEREVQFTSQLTHQNTIRVFDFGRTDEGVFYYAMEYLEGITLDKAVEAAGPLPEARVIHILRQVCGSLAEAHAAGLIHRDIKPANIILCELGGVYDSVKVLDFGLVKRTDQAQTAALTQAQMITGTPLYIAPEAISAPDKVDARADLYSLGCVGYYLLTGTPLFHGDAFEVCGQHLHKEVEPPSSRLGRPVSQDLEEVVMSCLVKDPAARVQDTPSLIAALERCKDSGIWTQEDARIWWEEKLDWSSIKRSEGAAPATPLINDAAALHVDIQDRGISGTTDG